MENTTSSLSIEQIQKLNEQLNIFHVEYENEMTIRAYTQIGLFIILLIFIYILVYILVYVILNK